MKIKRLDTALSVCKLPREARPQPGGDLWFLSLTDEELSLVCPTDAVPPEALLREDGWRAFRVEGPLDFSLVGILARLTDVLARGGIGLFAVSTYDTDYILVKAERFEEALALLADEGYDIV